MFVSTSLDTWITEQPDVFADDVQIDDTAYRRLDPKYYAWLRSRMNLAKLAAKGGKISQEAFDALRAKFNAIHEWAMARFGEDRLREAVHNLNARKYTPPAARDERAYRVARAAAQAAAAARAKVDAIRNQAMSLGWTQEALYGDGGEARTPMWKTCGLAGVLKPASAIGTTTPEAIEIVLPNGVRQHFYNPSVRQPWVRQAAAE